MKSSSTPRLTSRSVMLVACALGALAGQGCDNNRTSRNLNNGVPQATPRITGQVQAGPVSGATVTAFAINANGLRGQTLGVATSTSDGSYALVFNDDSFTASYNGAVLLEASGGTYTDEATGQTLSLGLPLRAILPMLSTSSSSSGSTSPVTVNLTPLTTLAAAQAQAATGGISSAGATAAKLSVEALFGNAFDILATKLVDPRAASANPTLDSVDASLAVAAISQLALDLNRSPDSLLASLVADASDGVLDGLDASGQVVLLDGSVTTSILRAVTRFANSQNNVAGLSLQFATQSALAASRGILAAATIPGLDSRAPTVRSRFPAPGALAVPINSRLFINFSEDLNPATVNSSNVSVTANGAPVQGTISYDPVTRNIAFTPATILPLNSSITFSVSTAVRDLAGNALASAETLRFQSGSLSQSGAGFLASITADPASVQSPVTFGRSIIVRADRPFNPVSLLGTGNITLVTGGQLVDVVVTPFNNQNLLAVTPVSPLSPDTIYTLTLGPAVADTNDNALGQVFQVNFQTRATGSVDNIPPAIASVAPAPGDSTVQPNATITITFNEAINPSSAIASVRLLRGSASIPVATRFLSRSNSLELTPLQALQVGVSYTISVPTSVADTAGNTLSAAFSSTFTIANPSLAITTNQLVEAIRGQSYSQSITSLGGQSPISFALAAGSSLPAGLQLAANGQISGTPTTAGTTTFTVLATDSGNPAQSASQVLSITVTDTPSNPTIAFASAQLASANESTAIVVTVQLVTPSPLASAASVQVVDLLQGSALSGTDYSPLNAVTLDFPSGATNGATRTLVITPIDDNINEGPETLTLGLTNVQGGAVIGGASTTTITINDDDNQPTVSVSTSTTTITEGQVGQVNFTLSNPTTNNVTVNFSVSGTALVSGDHSLSSGMVSIPAGQTTLSLPFNSTDDNFDEDDAETIIVTLTSASSASVSQNPALNSLTINLADNDAFATASVSSPAPVLESNGTATFTVSIAPPHGRSSPVSVTIATADATAVSAAGGDYVSRTSNLSFAAGASSATFVVTINEDAIDENDETFTVSLSQGNNLAIGAGSASLTILDNDAPSLVSFTVSSSSVGEAAGQATITARLDRASGKIVTVPFIVDASSTATFGQDHNLSSGAFPDIAATNILPGQTQTSISFNILQDNLTEGNETIVVDLGIPTNADLATQNTRQTLTILDDEGLPSVSLTVFNPATGLALSPNPANNNRLEAVENVGRLALRFNLNNPSTQAVAFDLQLALGNTSQPVDSTDLGAGSPAATIYVARNGTLNPRTVGAFEPFVSGQPFTTDELVDLLSVQNNEGIAITSTGDLVQAGDVSIGGTISPSIRTFRRISDRPEGASFDQLQGDRIIVGARTRLVQPKGLDIDTERARILVADLGGRQILVFDLVANGDVDPIGRIALDTLTGIAGNPWDLDFDSASNRLFVVMTSGEVLVFDNLFAADNSLATTTPARSFAIGFDSGSGLVKDSINLHGVDYVASVDRLILSDVGSAASTTDGKLYIIDSASTAGAALASPSALATAALRIITGAGVRLGNPVDIAFDGANLYVAEKTSDGADLNSVLIYENFLSLTTSGSIAPTTRIELPAGSGPESVAIDSGLRRDHRLKAQRITIPAGQTQLELSFDIDDDSRDEDDETFSISLGNFNNGVPGANNSPTIQLQDNDVEPTISILGDSVLEGEDADLDILLSATSGRTVSVTYSTTDGTATSGLDYTAQGTTTVVIREGQRVSRIRATTLVDTINEPTETFTVGLDANPVNALPGSLVATVSISDNNQAPSIDIIGPATLLESSGTVVYTAQLSGPSGFPISATLSLSGAHPNFSANDLTFSPNPRTLSFAPGQTSINFSISVQDDALNEADESFTLALSQITNATAGAAANRTITITDNDPVSATLSNTQNGAEPGTPARFSLTLSRQSEQSLSFSVSLAGSGLDPTEAGDLSAPASITVNPGQTNLSLDIQVNDDAVNEATETFTVSLALQNPSSINGFDAMGSTLASTSLLADDDTLTLNLSKTQDGAEPGTAAIFTATLNRLSEQALNFSVNVAGSGAEPAEASDFSAPNSLAINPGSMSATLSVSVIDDAVNEASEALTATLSLQGGPVSGFNLAGSNLTANALIADDDSLTLTLSKTQDGAEPGTAAIFTATLNRLSEQALNFSVNVAGSGAEPAEASDFSAPNSLAINPGSMSATLSVSVIDDAVNEASERISAFLTLQGSVNGFNSTASLLRADAQINDNDSIQVTITAQPATAAVQEFTNAIQFFDIAINGSTEQSFSIDFASQASAPVSATLNADYQLPITTSVSFLGTSSAPASGTRVVQTTLIDDNLNEADERYALVLTGLSGSTNGVTLSATPAQVTIIDQDPVSVTLSTQSNGTEGGAASLSASLNRMSAQTLTFSISAAGSGVDPAEVSDFALGATSLTFAPGQTTLPITVNVNEDSVNEANEGLTVTLAMTSLPMMSVNGFDAAGSVLSSSLSLLDNDDISISITTDAGTFTEGNPGDDRRVGFTVTSSGPSEQIVLVNVASAATVTAPGDTGDATPGTDFVNLNSSLTFGLAPLAQPVSLSIVEDLDAEQNERLQVQISLAASPRGVSIAQAAAIATITDDDNAGASLIAAGPFTEGSTATVEVRLSGPKSQAVTTTVNMTASNGGVAIATEQRDTTDFETTPARGPVAIYAAQNGATRLVERRTPNGQVLDTTYDLGGNQGLIFDADGRLFQASDLGGAPSIRIFPNASDRSLGASFDPQQDTIIRGPATLLNNPKGIDIDTRRALIFVANNGGQQVLVFRTTDSGDVAPAGNLSVSPAPWDIDYDSASDRLFIAQVNGDCLVYDNFVATYVKSATNANPPTSGTPTRTITPARAGVKASVNLHGIDYLAASDTLLLSDVGLASSGTDGALFVMRNILAQSPSQVLINFHVRVAGPNSQLGNPVDLLADNNGRVLIAEKFNDRLLGFDLASLPAGPQAELDVAASINVNVSKPESIALDFGLRRDTTFDSTQSRSLTFAPGEVSKTVSFGIVNDTRHEGAANEVFGLTLAVASGPAVGATTSRSYEIIDDDAQPSITLLGIDAVEGSAVRFLARLNRASGLTPTATFTATDGTTPPAATIADSDYSATTANLTFAEGQTLLFVDVPTTQDTRAEDNESLGGRLDAILLAQPNGGPVTASASILNDDGVPRIDLSAGGSVAESNGNTLVWTVTLVNPLNGQPTISGQDVTVRFSTTGGSATAGADYTALSNVLVTVPTGQSTATVAVSILGDSINEADETITGSISSATNGLINPMANSASATILDNDDVTISVASASLNSEGDAGSAPLAFPLTLSGPSEQAVSVAFSTSNGSASAGSDFAAATGITANFAPLSTSSSATIQVTGDLLNEANESFTLTLSAPTGRGVTIAQASATGTINDDDDISLAFAAMDPAAVVEGAAGAAGIVNFQIVASGKPGAGIGQNFTVLYSSSDDSALAGLDYTAVSNGTVLFSAASPSQTTLNAPVNLIGDAVNEATQRFTANILGLQSPARGVTIGTKTVAVGTISDDDLLIVDFMAGTTFNLTEGNSGLTTNNLVLQASRATEQSFSFSFALQANGSARDVPPDQDFVPDSGTRAFSPSVGQVTIPVQVNGDLIDELDETLVLALSGLTAENTQFAVSASSSRNQTLTILDDDNAPTLSFDLMATQTSVSEAEADGKITVAFRLSTVSGRDVTFQFNSAAGTATPNAPRPDYTDASGVRTIPTGQTSLSFEISINNDLVNEADETILAQATAGNGVIIPGGTISQTLTITNDDALEVSIADVNFIETDVNQNVTLTVSINRDTEQVFTLNFATADGTADNVGTNMGDYEALAGTVTFNGVTQFGTRTQSIAVRVNGDAINETQETFTVSLSALSVPGAITRSVGLVTIVDNDILQVTVSDPGSVGESNEAVTFSVDFSRPSEQVILMNYGVVTTGIAEPTEPADLVNTSGSLVFAPLVTQIPVEVGVKNDDVNEADESFKLAITLVGTPDNIVLTKPEGTATVLDDDNIRVEFLDGPNVSENEPFARFPVVLTDVDTAPNLGPTEQNFSVTVITNAPQFGNPAQGDFVAAITTDYILKQQTLTFGAGITQVNFDVTVVDDSPAVNEAPETFGATLTPVGTLPRGVTVGVTQETGVITDDDLVTLTLDDSTNIEGSNGAATNFTFVLTIAGRTAQFVNLGYFVEAGGNNPGTPSVDFVQSNNVFALPSDTVSATRIINLTAQVFSDTINETNQTFQLRLNPANLPAGFLIADGIGLGTITDDDPISISIVAQNANVPESGGTATALVRLTGTDPMFPATQTEQTFNVTLATGNVTAVAPGDYIAVSTQVAINGTPSAPTNLIDRPVAITINNDTINESNETFNATVSALSPVGTNLVSISGMNTASFTILDDDVLVVGLRVANQPVDEDLDASFELFVVTSDPGNTATGTEQAFSFNFRTGETTPPQATSGIDFTAIAARTVTITPVPGPFTSLQTLASTVVDIIDETAGGRINEPFENFLGFANMIMNGNNVRFVASATEVSAAQTIDDNDLIVLTITSNGPATEADGGTAVSATLTVNLGGDADLTAQAFSIPIVLDPNGTSTATANIDYSTNFSISPNLMFTGGPDAVPATATVTIGIVNNDVNEAVETLQVGIGNPINNLVIPPVVPVGVIVLPGMGVANQLINDDDLVDFQIVPGLASANESTSPRAFNLVLGPGTSANSTQQQFAVSFTTMDGSTMGGANAQAGLDYAATTTNFLFNGTMAPDAIAGRQVTVAIVADTINEPTENFRGVISLPVAVNGVSISVANGNAAIVDDDTLTLTYLGGADNQIVYERGNGGQRAAPYSFVLTGATTSAQDITVTLTLAGGTANPPNVVNPDLEFVNLMGLGQAATNPFAITIPANTPLTGQTFTYQVNTITDASGDENIESFVLTTSATPAGSILIATGSGTLNGTIVDNALLNLLGPGMLANAIPTRVTMSGAPPVSIAPNAVVINNGQALNGGAFTVSLIGMGTLPGDTIQIVPANGITLMGTTVLFNGSAFATVSSPVAVVAAPATSVSLVFTGFNANASEGAVAALVSTISFNTVAAGGGRLVEGATNIASGGAVPGEGRLVNFTVN